MRGIITANIAYSASGAFTIETIGTAFGYDAPLSKNYDARRIIFNANYGTSQENNPMKGHAGGSEIKPYTILSVPIYIY